VGTGSEKTTVNLPTLQSIETVFIYTQQRLLARYGASDIVVRCRADTVCCVEQSHVKPFVFGAIGTTDEKSKATQSARALAEIGTIRIEYKRVKNVRQVRVSNKKKRKTYFSESDDGSAEEGQEHLLDEKAKKAQFGLSAGQVSRTSL